MRTTEYAPGRLADVFGDPSHPTLLMWHGMQSDAREAVRPLATLLAERGFGVVAADWNSHAPDGGREDLLGSVAFAQSWSDGDGRLALLGWSLGGAAAAGLTVHADRFGIDITHTVCLAGAFTAPDPISGEPAAEGLSAARIGAPVTLLHGLADTVVPAAASREFATALEEVGWSVDVVELPADHGQIAGARWDAATDRYVPADDEPTLRIAEAVADHIAAALR
ncbi:dienelactone hydrolase family protein [Mycobacterium sp. ACS4331]|uniref:alpha/beta hydrolase family protein n=1 Tax=Mycobacterium sp. ACS4331 TaxID=1834121 RepID=UPI0007FC50E5|nr:dienelactone hydrolase family protein [Mycobacterium sp. ACS4331]OBF13027.1 esterase [Mycobacterium sp. ACS4331]